jgi:pyruvate kinase
VVWIEFLRPTPATFPEEALRALLQAGMNVARLNFSHGTPAEHLETIERLRRLAEALAIPVAILQDLTGPKVRIGAFADGTVELRAGAPFTLTTRVILGGPEAVSVSYAGLPEAVVPEDRLLLADGTVELRVREIEGSEIRCTVVTGGMLSARKGVNVPSGLPGLPILGEKDLRDLRFGVQHGVDYVGLSFVRTAEDVRTAKRAMAGLGGRAPVIAKIETRAALDHLDEILDEADGVMVARGDLSIETAFTRVPIVQKAVIAGANRRAKPAITATQMLYSMVDSPTCPGQKPDRGTGRPEESLEGALSVSGGLPADRPVAGLTRTGSTDVVSERSRASVGRQYAEGGHRRASSWSGDALVTVMEPADLRNDRNPTP